MLGYLTSWTHRKMDACFVIFLQLSVNYPLAPCSPHRGSGWQGNGQVSTTSHQVHRQSRAHDERDSHVHQAHQNVRVGGCFCTGHWCTAQQGARCTAYGSRAQRLISSILCTFITSNGRAFRCLWCLYRRSSRPWLRSFSMHTLTTI